jgi:trans-aconitate methyltransferase
MPYSLDTYNSLFKEHISKLEISSFLDVGAGSGKYGKLIKESFPSASVLALEPTQKYIEEFNLEKKTTLFIAKKFKSLRNLHQGIDMGLLYSAMSLSIYSETRQ